MSLYINDHALGQIGTFKLEKTNSVVAWNSERLIDLRGDLEIKCMIKEARGSFFGLKMDVLKLQSRIQDKLRSPSYYIIISTYDQS